MDKLVIIGVIALLILGIVFGGYYFMQNQSGSSQNQVIGGNKGISIPSDSALKLFDILEKGLNG